MTEVEGMNRLSTGKEKNPDWPKDGEGKSWARAQAAAISQCLFDIILCAMWSSQLPVHCGFWTLRGS